MKEVGQVTAIDGGTARIRFKRSSACQKCGACMMSQSQQEMFLNVENTLQAAEGDWVKVDIESPMLIKASLITYIFPLVMLILGLVAGYFLNEAAHITANSEVVAAIGGLLFVAVSYGVIRLLEPRFRKTRGFTPRMIERAEEPPELQIENGEDTQNTDN